MENNYCEYFWKRANAPFSWFGPRLKEKVRAIHRMFARAICRQLSPHRFEIERSRNVLGIWLVASLAVFIAPAQATDFSASGPFAVGVQTFALGGENGLHPLTGIMWYPASGASANLIGTPVRDVHPAKDAAPAAGDRFPLLVLIPGLDSFGTHYETLSKLLASNGFVVMAADYDLAPNLPPDPGMDRVDFDKRRLLYDRPANVLRVIAFADQATAPGGKWVGLIDTARIGVFGHSTGGTTGLQAGGAQIDFQALSDWCTANAKNMEVKYGESCAFLGHEQAIAKVYGSDDAFGGLLPALWDKRVAALVLVAPGGELHVFGSSGLAKVTVPTLFIVSADDGIVNPETNAFWAYQNIGSKEEALATFEGGGHTMILGFGRQFDAAAFLTTAFFLSHLKGDTEAEAALLPTAVDIPGMAYEAILP